MEQDGVPNAGSLNVCVREREVVLRNNPSGIQKMLLTNYSVFHFVFYAS